MRDVISDLMLANNCFSSVSPCKLCSLLLSEDSESESESEKVSSSHGSRCSLTMEIAKNTELCNLIEHYV